MDLSSLYIGKKVQVQFEVSSSSTGTFLEWYNGTIIQLACVNGSTATTSIRYTATDDFKACTESYILSSLSSLKQGNKTFPFRTSPTTPNTSARDVGRRHSVTVEQSNEGEPTLKDIVRRLSYVEHLLSQSQDKVYHNFAGILNCSLQKYIKRLRRPSSTIADLEGGIWTTAMDCSYSDYKSFTEFIRRQSNINVTIGNSDAEDTSRMFHPTQTIEFPTFRDLTNLFNISKLMYEKIIAVKRVDRQGHIIGFKAVGTFLQPENTALPRIFCLGGNATQWTDCCKYFQREHGHITQVGVFSAPFLRVRSKTALETILEHLDSTRCSHFQFKWTPTTIGTICSVGIPDTVIMGKLVLTIPYNTFHDMTMATKVNDCLTPSNDGNETDSSSESW